MWFAATRANAVVVAPVDELLAHSARYRLLGGVAARNAFLLRIPLLGDVTGSSLVSHGIEKAH